MRFLALVLLVAGCGLPSGEVLSSQSAWTDCESALDKATKGDLCVGITQCERKGKCCVEKLECSSGQITAIDSDCSACPPCTSDESCPNQQWCLQDRCDQCPTANCPGECPAPFVRLNRHGCETCDCGPATNLSCPPSEKTLPSAYCQSGCTGPSCCVGACTTPECADTPSPEGCMADCGAISCTTCRAEACQCNGGTWQCTARCASGLEGYVKRCKAQ